MSGQGKYGALVTVPIIQALVTRKQIQVSYSAPPCNPEYFPTSEMLNLFIRISAVHIYRTSPSFLVYSCIYKAIIKVHHVQIKPTSWFLRRAFVCHTAQIFHIICVRLSEGGFMLPNISLYMYVIIGEGVHCTPHRLNNF